jgi:Right handed beta helix region
MNRLCLQTLTLTLLTAPLYPCPPAHSSVIQVGPLKHFAAPCQAIAKARPGDLIEIDSSIVYRGDVCAWKTNGLTLRGVGPGRAHIDAAGRHSQGKGIWVIAGNDTTVENIEFSGAAVPDQNGAAIREEGANLTIRNCYFHDNEEGILAGDSSNSSVLIEYSEFAYNGSGNGYTHNLYVNHVAKFTLRFSYSHHAKVGHLAKSRAAENYILYNRLSDEADGTASFELDLPNGGTSFVIGNVIEQGPQTENSTILAYRMEGGDSRNPGTALYVVNNTFVNNRPGGGTFLQIKSDVPTPALILNNIFYGRGTLVTQSKAVLQNNLVERDPRFINPQEYDYHLQPSSPARRGGSLVAPVNGFPLLPNRQYKHPACGQLRTVTEKPDLGAYEANSTSEDLLGPDRCLDLSRP